MQKLFRAFSVNFRKFSNSQRVCQMPKPSNVLSELPEKLLAELFKHAVEHNLRDGEVLFRAADVGDGCYRIQTGLVKVVVTSQQGEDCIISLLGADAIVGELSVIDGGPRSASVVAIADCSLLFFSRAKFQTCIDSHPELASYLVRTLARRLREADDALAATTFLSVKGDWPGHCSTWRSTSAKTRVAAGSSCDSRSVRATSLRWQAWRERT